GRGDDFRVGGAAHREAGNHHHEKDQAFEYGGEVLDFAAHADALPLEQSENYDGGDADDFYAQRAVEHGEKVREIFAEDDADGAGCAAGGNPVAPADDEASVFAKGAAGEIILAAAGGNEGAEFGDLESAQESVECAADPDGEEEPGVGEDGGDAAGGAENADGDGIADGDGDTEADTEDLEEFAFVWAVGKAAGCGCDGVSGRGCGQSGVSILDQRMGHHTFAGGKREEEE